MKIIVPATSANLGGGFDSIGLAVNLYLELEIFGESEDWEIEHTLGADIPSGKENLILSTALDLAPSLRPHKLSMRSNIPLEHGLGSSSSAIVAGIELACLLGDLSYTQGEKLQLACQIEGHPDNVVPAYLGGLVVSSYSDGQLDYVRLPPPDCVLVASVPAYNVATTEARRVLPDFYPRGEAVLASSRSNVLTAALAQGDLELAGRLMEQDLFHEPYRQALVPELERVRRIGRAYGAYGTYLSGAGSTIMTLIAPEKLAAFREELEKLEALKILELQADTVGFRSE